MQGSEGGPYIIGLAFVMSCVGCGLGLSAMVRARSARGPARERWLALGAVAIGGTGIWVMHFIAMLGYSLPNVQIRYNLPITLASLLVAVTVLWFGLRFTLRGGSIASVIPGGVVTGIGVAGMHYLGMAAMDVSASVQYRPWVVALSVLIAVTAATVALWFAANLDSAGRDARRCGGHGCGGVRDALHRMAAMVVTASSSIDRHGAHLDPAPRTPRDRRQRLDLRDPVDDRPQPERAGDRTGGRDQGEPSQTLLDARTFLTRPRAGVGAARTAAASVGEREAVDEDLGDVLGVKAHVRLVGRGHLRVHERDQADLAVGRGTA